jgi:hypothetical protein
LNHLTQCREVVSAIRKIWLLNGPDGVPLGVRLARLASIISNQNDGTQGAGLTGGVQQEALFKDMLLYGDRRFRATSQPSVTDADYYFGSYPLSHKTIGFQGNGDLALAWSKNPPEGVVRDKFQASMVIMSYRKSAQRGKWVGLPNGAYVVPMDFLEGRVTFASNNKTDSLIRSSQVVAAMRYALDQNLVAPLAYSHGYGVAMRVSLWHSGADPDIPPLPATLRVGNRESKDRS